MSKEVGEMVRSRDVVQAEGSARTEGARRATGVRADGAAAGAGSLAPGQRWSKVPARLRILDGIRVARGLALRMDHGSQYLSDHFLKQIRYWGIHPSFGFVEEPETNGVAERWNRTLKEQAIHGRIFQNLEAVRAAVADFVERYNQTWRLEKLGYHTPIEAREEYELRQAA